MTRSTSLGADGFWADGRRRTVVSAQFDYFRHDRVYWSRILHCIRDAGIPIVSSFIAWDFHETSPGAFDFTGATHPSRDLCGYLELCAEFGLLVFARPGPCIDAEWETRGPARDVMQLDRLHPHFRARSSQWLSAVSEVLAPAQVTRGGPVAAVGIDNEALIPWATTQELHQIDGDVVRPYDADLYEGLFRAWCLTQFGNLAEVNESLGTGFTEVGEIRPPRFADDPPQFCHAGIEFLNSALCDYFSETRQLLTSKGIDVPTFTNQWALAAHVDWTRVPLDSVGMNLFMPDRMHGDHALIANWWFRLHFARFRFRWAAEMQSGWIGLFEEFGFLSPHHTEYMPMAAQAIGLRGLNFFLFAEREDWAHAPVNALGKRRPERYERIQRVVRSYSAIADDDLQLADVGLVWSLDDVASQHISIDDDWNGIHEHNDRLDEAKGSPTWWATFRELVDADVDFRLWIPGVSPQAPPAVAVHAGLPTCGDRHFEELVAAATKGLCTVVEITPLPTLDLAGNCCPERVTALAQSPAPRLRAASIADLRPLTRQLGARSFARASERGIWTHIYRAADGSTVLGLWNPKDSHFSGYVALAEAALPPACERLTVFEPRTGERWDLPREQVRRFVTEMEPNSARVLQLTPGMSTHTE